MFYCRLAVATLPLHPSGIFIIMYLICTLLVVDEIKSHSISTSFYCQTKTYFQTKDKKPDVYKNVQILQPFNGAAHCEMFTRYIERRGGVCPASVWGE